mmetsp:Transcript_29545/g.81212  ORF Transcript_29545/g.81212 Transcript_29545/m.81212 type:complete len:181 (-) Transcript_29545:1668-2210(-)
MVLLLVLSHFAVTACAFQLLTSPVVKLYNGFHHHQRFASSRLYARIELESLMDMDVVFYSNGNSGDEKAANIERKLKIGAVQEDGTLLPLSAWSDEPAFANSIEFVVDEEDRIPGGLDSEQITIESIVPEESLSYGSRQVGGGKGPGNPHGEESELLYYVDQELLQNIEVTVKPELEILW